VPSSAVLSSGETSERRELLVSRLEDARARTDAIFSLLQSDAIYDRAIPERHRLIFYLGHLEAFDWNLLARTACKQASFHPEFDQLFAFGIDPVGGGLPSDQPSDWPREAVVRRYNSRVRKELDKLINGADLFNAEDGFLGNGTLLHVAIEHRLMHVETLTYLLHELPFDRKVSQPESVEPRDPRPSPEFSKARIPEGLATLGQTRTENVFGWDNEFEWNQVEVPAFAIDSYPVTNSQFLKFIRVGGYASKAYWNEADWDWRIRSGLEHPHFWLRDGSGWAYRGLFDKRPLPMNWPVYVSHAEASAYCRWAGKRLATEAEWHRAAYGTPGGTERDFPWGAAQPEVIHGNFNFANWNPSAVDGHPEGESGFGVFDLLGNGWEWTASPFAPFPGFQPFPFYRGYSADFFDGQHYVMKGGSSQTAACMLRRSFRNWFQPHYPYMYAKFRCVED
jgi:iron(II)-dependent oxidoreductase